MKDMKLKVIIPGDLLKRLGFQKKPKKKILKRTAVDAFAIYAGLRDGTWNITEGTRE